MASSRTGQPRRAAPIVYCRPHWPGAALAEACRNESRIFANVARREDAIATMDAAQGKKRRRRGLVEGDRATSVRTYARAAGTFATVRSDRSVAASAGLSRRSRATSVLPLPAVRVRAWVPERGVMNVIEAGAAEYHPVDPDGHRAYIREHRPRSLVSKLIDEHEAIERYVDDGDYLVYDCNYIMRGPSSLMRELIRQRKRDLWLAGKFTYVGVALLTGAGCVSKIDVGFFSPGAIVDEAAKDGRVVGNWFQRGTNGYQGAGGERYRAGHLAIAYYHLDPSLVVISLGTFDGASAQFAVRGNTPNPANVSVASGLVVYELVQFVYWVADERWDRSSRPSGLTARDTGSEPRGVVLFQLVDDRTLKVETFPGKSASEVTGFSEAALSYER